MLSWLPGAAICVKRTVQKRGNVAGLLSDRPCKVADTDVISAMVRFKGFASADGGMTDTIAVVRKRRLRHSHENFAANGLNAALVRGTLTSVG